MKTSQDMLLDLLGKLPDNYCVKPYIAFHTSSGDLLRKMADDKDEYVRASVVRNCHCPVDVLVHLSNDESAVVKKYIAYNKHTPRKILRLLAKDTSTDVRKRVANCSPVDILLELANDKEADVRSEVAYNPKCPINILKTLAKDASAKVRKSAALALLWYDTPTDDTDWVEFFSKDSNESIREIVAASQKISHHIRVRLARDESELVKQTMAENIAHNYSSSSQLPFDCQELLNILAGDENASVRIAVAKCPCSVEILEKLSKDSDASVREAVAHNRHCSDKFLALLYKDSNVRVRAAAASKINHTEIPSALCSEYAQILSAYIVFRKQGISIKEKMNYWREHSDFLFIKYSMMDSSEVGYELLEPEFLVELREEDDALLCALGKACKHIQTSKKTNKIAPLIKSILSNKNIPDRVHACLWFCMKDILYPHPSKHASGSKCDYGLPPGFLFRDVQTTKELREKHHELMRSVLDDNAPLFEIERTISGKHLCKTLLGSIIFHRSSAILCHLLQKHLRELCSILSPRELLTCLCSRLHWGSSYEPYRHRSFAPILDVLEKIYPGISKTSVDDLGNTPLWYCLFSEDNMELEEALIKYGCDPDARNHLNLSYNLCKQFVGKDII